MGVLCHFVAALSYVFYDPILSPALIVEVGVGHDICGLCFAMMSLFYAIGCVVMGKLSSKVDKRILISMSFFLVSASIYFSGGLPSKSVVATMIGLAGVGFFYSGCLLPVIPEIINIMQADFESVKEKERKLLDEEDDYKFGPDALLESIRDDPGKNNITDKTMALLAISYAFGSITGPIVGGWLFDMDGFGFTTFCISVVAMIWFFSYTIIVFIGDCSLESTEALQE